MKTREDLQSALREGPKKLPGLSPSTPVVVYGAGGCGRDMARALQVRGYQVLGFLDRNAEPGASIGQWPCLRPQEAACHGWRESGALVVIGVWNASAPVDDIERDLLAGGWSQTRTLPQVYEVLQEELGDRFWLGHRDLYREAAVHDRILAAFDLWSDDQSRHIFVRAIESRLRGEVGGLNDSARADAGPQYLPRDVPGWPSPRRFVDGGAFDGDTLGGLPWAQLESVAAFEPDARNFARLAHWCREHAPEARPQPWSQPEPQIAPQIALWPCGLWERTTHLHFSDGEGASSHVAQEGGVVVPVVALDDVLIGWAPDLIKLDIEGAEPQALEGARGIIHKHRPALAVCVYHRPEHLWSLVLQIASFQEPYKYFLRAHHANGLEWVLYALP